MFFPASDAQQAAQRLHVLRHGMRLAVDGFGPGLGRAVDPGQLHARGQGAGPVQMGVVADVQHRVLGHAGRLGGGGEDAAVGLADADLGGADGGVEVLAVCDVASLDALQAWLHEGPPLAHVDHVAREDVEADGVPVGFNIA